MKTLLIIFISEEGFEIFLLKNYSITYYFIIDDKEKLIFNSNFLSKNINYHKLAHFIPFYNKNIDKHCLICL